MDLSVALCWRVNETGVWSAADACRVEQRAETLPTSGRPRGERECQGQGQGLRQQVHVQVPGSVPTFQLLSVVLWLWHYRCGSSVTVLPRCGVADVLVSILTVDSQDNMWHCETARDQQPYAPLTSSPMMRTSLPRSALPSSLDISLRLFSFPSTSVCSTFGAFLWWFSTVLIDVFLTYLLVIKQCYFSLEMLFIPVVIQFRSILFGSYSVLAFRIILVLVLFSCMKSGSFLFWFVKITLRWSYRTVIEVGGPNASRNAARWQPWAGFKHRNLVLPT